MTIRASDLDRHEIARLVALVWLGRRRDVDQSVNLRRICGRAANAAILVHLVDQHAQRLADFALQTAGRHTLRNPNRARSLIFSFCSGNPAQFHAADGSGYAYWAEQVLALDAINPQVSARLARSLDRWRKYVPTLRDAMQDALKRVAAHPSLSRDVREIVSKALA